VFSEPLSGRDIESLLCSSFSATRCIAGAA
jgi:hypothetical protein